VESYPEHGEYYVEEPCPEETYAAERNQEEPFHEEPYQEDSYQEEPCFEELDVLKWNDELSDADIDDQTTRDDELAESLRELHVSLNVPSKTTDAILKLLNQHGHILPFTTRTLMRTKRNIQIAEISGMQSYQYDLFTEITGVLDKYEIPFELREICLQLNIDGVPLYGSSKACFWPVLCSIDNLRPRTVFPLLILFGNSKPSDLHFLDGTLEQLNDFIERGLEYRGRYFELKVSSVLADLPARAMIRATKGHAGYSSCSKCHSRGEYIGSKVVFLNTTFKLREDSSFRAQADSNHHVGISPFVRLPIDMVKSFPLDYMHLVCLGVMRRLLSHWLKWPGSQKLCESRLKMLDTCLAEMSAETPSCFQRKVVGLKNWADFKATQLRQILLYTGNPALDVLTEDARFHFRCLSVAIRILLDKDLSVHLAKAEELLVYFVEEGVRLYGAGFAVTNTHGLLHLVEDYNEYGPLDGISCFPYENFLGVLKRRIRSGHQPLKQAVARLSEKKRLKPKPIYSPITEKQPDSAVIVEDDERDRTYATRSLPTPRERPNFGNGQNGFNDNASRSQVTRSSIFSDDEIRPTFGRRFTSPSEEVIDNQIKRVEMMVEKLGSAVSDILRNQEEILQKQEQTIDMGSALTEIKRNQQEILQKQEQTIEMLRRKVDRFQLVRSLTLEDLEAVDCKLGTEAEYFKQWVSYVKTLRGNTNSHSIAKALSDVAERRIFLQFNWEGRNGKLSFLHGLPNLTRALRGAFGEVDVAIQTYLKNTKGTLSKAEKRKLDQPSDNDDTVDTAES